MKNLYSILVLVSIDTVSKNGAESTVRPLDCWPITVGDYDLEYLEIRARGIIPENLLILADGSKSEIKKIVDENYLEELNNFLNAAVNGHLRDVFFQ